MRHPEVSITGGEKTGSDAFNRRKKEKQPQVAELQTEVGGYVSVQAVYFLYKEDDTMSFGENLHSIRKNNKLSQEGLAEMLGVSRQAVSKWELGDGYPEVDKLLILSEKLGVSLDSLLRGENAATISEEGKPEPSETIRIISPHEGVIINASKVTRSQEFKGRKNSPKFALAASARNDQSAWGAQNTFLGWYRNLEDVTREIDEIQKALEAGAASYTLQYSVKCKQNLFRTIEE